MASYNIYDAVASTNEGETIILQLTVHNREQQTTTEIEKELIPIHDLFSTDYDDEGGEITVYKQGKATKAIDCLNLLTSSGIGCLRSDSLKCKMTFRIEFLDTEDGSDEGDNLYCRHRQQQGHSHRYWIKARLV